MKTEPEQRGGGKTVADFTQVNLGEMYGVADVQRLMKVSENTVLK